MRGKLAGRGAYARSLPHMEAELVGAKPRCTALRCLFADADTLAQLHAPASADLRLLGSESTHSLQPRVSPIPRCLGSPLFARTADSMVLSVSPNFILCSTPNLATHCTALNQGGDASHQARRPAQRTAAAGSRLSPATGAACAASRSRCRASGGTPPQPPATEARACLVTRSLNRAHSAHHFGGRRVICAVEDSHCCAARLIPGSCFIQT